jgi:MFS family permease
LIAAASSSGIRLGLRANLRQFALLVGVNALVGGMVGLERTLLPIMAEQEFHLSAHSAILSFLIAFGSAKALANYVAGRWSDRAGRKRVLVAGWLLTLPVPFMLMYAPSWSWIIVTNILLGLGQGLTWSATVIMKIDLAGPERRGLAMGLNEFAGYLAVALSALLTARIAAVHGLRPNPFLLGVGFAIAGMVLSVVVVRETRQHAALEQRGAGHHVVSAKDVFLRTSWRDRPLRGITQAGLVNNLNDGVAWGLFPLLFAQSGLTLAQIGAIGATYPATWGIAQLVTGGLSDRFGRRTLITAGMILQGIALVAIAAVTQIDPGSRFAAWSAGAVALGVGTAMVYPTLLAAIGDFTQPSWRASAVGVYRLWRDLGYVAGAVIGGLLADAFSVPLATAVVGVLTAASGFWAAVDLMVRPMADPRPSVEPPRSAPSRVREGRAQQSPGRA